MTEHMSMIARYPRSLKRTRASRGRGPGAGARRTVRPVRRRRACGLEWPLRVGAWIWHSPTCLKDRLVIKMACIATHFPELPGSGYPVAEAVPIGTAVSRPPLSTSSRRTHQPQCGGRIGQELIRRYGPEISERVDKLIPDAVCSHRLHVDLGGRMGSWKGRMLDLFGAAGIRKSQRLPQLGVMVTPQREKAPVRARRDPAFRAFERSPHPSASVGVSRVRSD